MARAHATVAGLAERERLQALAEAATADPLVDDALLKAAIDAALDTFDAQRQAAARMALANLQRKVDDANAEVDLYLARYPEAPAGGALAVPALDIAAWRVLGGDTDSERYKRYAAAIRFLEGVAAGRIDLPGGAGGGAGADAGEVLYSAPDATFTDAALEPFVNPRRVAVGP